MPGELPSGWRTSKFEQVASVERGLTYRNDQECAASDDNAVCVLRIPNVQNQRFVEDDLKYINGVSDRQVSKYSVPSGSILMVGSNGNADRVGNCCFVESSEGYLFASFLMRVVPHVALAEPRFFFYLLAGGDVQGAITDAVAGTTGLKNISLEMLRAHSLALPPLSEQRKIATILSSMDEAIKATQAVIDQTRRVNQGLLQDLLTRGIGHTRFKQTEIGEIPESWEVRPLSHVLSACTYGFTNPMPTTDIGPWMVTAANIVDGRIDYERTRKTSAEAYERDLSGKSKPQVGDVLVTKDGTLGRVAVVDRPDICINQSVAVLRPSLVSAKFLMYLLQSPPWQDRMIADAGGSTIKHIYVSKLANMAIPVPPASEREKIVHHVDSSAESIRCEANELRSLVDLKAGILQDLLTGRVRVAA